MQQGIDGGAGPNHQQHLERGFEIGDQSLQGEGADDVAAGGWSLHKSGSFAGGSIVNHNPVSLIADIQGQILSHHGQTDEADVSLRHAHSFLGSTLTFPGSGVNSPGIAAECSVTRKRVCLQSP